MRIPNLIFSTIILFISNFVVRILGFIYKIFLSRIVGESGLGIYHILFNFLMASIALTTTGIPTALSCLVANKNALKDKHSKNVLFISTLYVSFFISFTLSLLISFNAKYLSVKFFNDSRFYLLILGISPAVVVITISNVLRGYYYGIKNATVPAIGQVIEQVVRILFVFTIISYIKKDSLNCYIAILGISIGEIANIFFIICCLYKNSNLSNKYKINIRDFYNSSIETLKLSLPLTCNRMSNILLNSISSMIIPSRLALSGLSYHQSLSIYGVINGMVMPFIFIPFTLGSALVVNLIPSISQEVSLKNYKNIKLKTLYALLLTLFVGSLCSIVFYLFGDKLCLIVFKNSSAGMYLKSMFLLPLFTSLNQTLSAILHAVRKEIESSIITISTMVIQLILLYILLPIPSININGYIYTTTLTAMLASLLHTIVLYRSFKFSKY